MASSILASLAPSEVADKIVIGAPGMFGFPVTADNFEWKMELALEHCKCLRQSDMFAA